MKKPVINNITTPDKTLNNSIAAVKEIIEIREGDRGDPDERFVRVKDLLASGLAIKVVLPGGKFRDGGGNVGFKPKIEAAPEDEQTLVLDPIPDVVDFSITTGFFNNMLTWTFPEYNGHAYTEVYRSTVAATNSGVWLAKVEGSMYIDSVDPQSTHYYWVRHVNVIDEKGDFFPVGAGSEGTTSKTVGDMLTAASERIGATKLAATLLTSLNSIQYTDTQPTTKQDGRALIAGDRYVTTTKDEYIYTGSEWVNTTIDVSSFVTAANVTTSITEQVGYCTLDSGTGDNFSSIRQANLTTKSSCVDLNPSDDGTYVWHDSGAIAEKADTAWTTANDLSATVSTNSGSLDGLYAYYQVKIDNNGRISGFGLSSETSPSTLTNNTAFIVNADKFAIMNPTDTSTGRTETPEDANIPFIVETVGNHVLKQYSSPSHINGWESEASINSNGYYIRDDTGAALDSLYDVTQANLVSATDRTDDNGVFTYVWVPAATKVFLNADVVIKKASITAAQIQGVLSTNILKVPGKAWINKADIDQATINALTLTGFIKSSNWDGSIGYFKDVDTVPTVTTDYSEAELQYLASQGTQGFYIDRFHCYFNSDVTFGSNVTIGNDVTVNGTLEAATIKTGSKLEDHTYGYEILSSSSLFGDFDSTASFHTFGSARLNAMMAARGTMVLPELEGVMTVLPGSEFGTSTNLPIASRINSVNSTISGVFTAVVANDLSLWFRTKADTASEYGDWSCIASSYTPEPSYGPISLTWGGNLGVLAEGLIFQLGLSPISEPNSPYGSWGGSLGLNWYDRDRSDLRFITWSLNISNF